MSVWGSNDVVESELWFSFFLSREICHFGASWDRPPVEKPGRDLPPVGHGAPVHQQVLEQDQVDEGVDEVRVVEVLPLHRGEEEELGDGVDGDQDGQEGAEEEVPEADTPPDVKTNDPSEGDVDKDDHGGHEHEHRFQGNCPSSWGARD